MKALINVEVCFASREKQIIALVRLPLGTTAADAISASKIVESFPEIDLLKNRIGIFGKLCKLDTLVRDGDRVEIYRSLIADPKVARRKRAAGKLTG
jgi:uncharacterized protein